MSCLPPWHSTSLSVPALFVDTALWPPLSSPCSLLPRLANADRPSSKPLCAKSQLPWQSAPAIYLPEYTQLPTCRSELVPENASRSVLERHSYSLRLPGFQPRVLGQTLHCLRMLMSHTTNPMWLRKMLKTPKWTSFLFSVFIQWPWPLPLRLKGKLGHRKWKVT